MSSEEPGAREHEAADGMTLPPDAADAPQLMAGPQSALSFTAANRSTQQPPTTPQGYMPYPDFYPYPPPIYPGVPPYWASPAPGIAIPYAPYSSAYGNSQQSGYPGLPSYRYPTPYPYQPYFIIPAPPANGLAITSLICSCVAMAFGGAFFGVLTLPLGILGVIFGHISLSQIKRSGGRQSGQGLGIAGTIIGYGALAVALVFLIIDVLVFLPIFMNPYFTSVH